MGMSHFIVDAPALYLILVYVIPVLFAAYIGFSVTRSLRRTARATEEIAARLGRMEAARPVGDGPEGEAQQ